MTSHRPAAARLLRSLVCLLPWAAWACAAVAQPAYPSRPVQVVVGFPAGGAMDIATRIVTDAMAAQGLGPLVVINKPGASGTIAAAQVERAPADGYTILLATSANLGVAPALYPKLSYDADKSFAPIAQFAVGNSVVYAPGDSDARSLAALLAKIKARPGELSFASPGTGTTAHLSFEMLGAAHQLKLVHVPYRGSPPAVTAVVAKQLEFGVDAIGPVMAFVRSGQLKALAQTGAQRSTALPDVPTLAELGIQGVAAGTYLGFAAPAGTPPAIVQAWREAVRQALASPDTARKLADVGLDQRFLDSAAFERAMRSERPLWADAVKRSGATPN